MTDPPDSIIIIAPGIQGHDGVSLVSREAAKALATQGGRAWQTEVWSLSDADPISGVACHSARGSQVRFSAFGIECLRRVGPQTLILSTHTNLAPVALPALLSGAHLVVFLHGIEGWQPLSRLRRFALERADLLLANSAYTRREFRRANPSFRAKKIDVCPLGIPSTPPPTPSQQAPFALIVGRLSSLERYKGHDQLLESWSHVRAGFPAARLKIAGSGDDRPRLEEKARRLGHSGSVEFLGFVPNTPLADLYRDCSFFVMPSRGEGFGLVFLEAMRSGRACIAARGAPEEVVEHEQTGLIVDAHCPESLVSAIVRLFEAPETCQEMGQAGRRRFEERFTAEHFAARLRRFLSLHKA